MKQTHTADQRYATFVLAVDDLEWTKHWLGRLRCDQMFVSIARLPGIVPRVHIRAVESKATSKIEPVEPSPSGEYFSEAVDQTVATLDALWAVLAPTAEDTLVEDLRFSSFIEHLASVALSDLHPFEPGDGEATRVLRTISALSQRSIPSEEIDLEGLAVCTQYRAAVSRLKNTVEIPGAVRSWRITLVRAGSDEVNTLLGAQVASAIIDMGVATESPEKITPVPLGPAAVETAAAPVQVSKVPMRREPEPASPIAQITPPAGTGDETSERGTNASVAGESGPESTTATTESAGDIIHSHANTSAVLTQDLYLACRRRGFQVDAPEQENIVVGPAVVSMSLALHPGASIRPIEAVVEDLAREVGVPSITVENDPERPFHLRFLVARKDREFPELPSAIAPIVDVRSQAYSGLYLGRTLAGHDQLSYVSTWPHMLIGGTTGSGKTTFIRSLLRQLARTSPGLVKAIIVDGKGEVDYFHVLSPDHYVSGFPDVILGQADVPAVFEWLVAEEIPARQKLIRERALAAPQQRPRNARELYIASAPQGHADPFPPLIVVIDEFAEIMLRGGATATQFEQRVQQVAQMGRSPLIHMILATQRPDSSVISGAIKANLDARVALRLPTFHDSLTILGGKGAEVLLGRGDLVFRAAEQPPIRLQGYTA